MLICHFVDPDLGDTKEVATEQRNKRHWFWNTGFRYLLHTTTRGSEKFQAESAYIFFMAKKNNFQMLYLRF